MFSLSLDKVSWKARSFGTRVPYVLLEPPLALWLSERYMGGYLVMLGHKMPQETPPTHGKDLELNSHPGAVFFNQESIGVFILSIP